MGFDDFIKEMAENVKNYLPESYKDATVEVLEMNKLNDRYKGLRVALPDERVAPCFNLHTAYDAYLDGVDLKEIMERAADVITMPCPSVTVYGLLDYDSVKDKLFIRVSNAERNQEVLAGLPHTMIADLAITYHILLDNSDGAICSAPVNETLFENYGVTVEQLHEDAMKNSPRVLPVKTDSVDEIMKNEMRRCMAQDGCDAEEIKEALADFTPDLKLQVVTNAMCNNGASAIFYPGTMDAMAEKMGGDFFVIPSSVDEVLLVPDDGNSSIAQLNAMIREVNEAQVKEEMRLGSEVYHYDASDRVFEKASDHVERMAQKTAGKEAYGEKNSIIRKMDEKKKEITGSVRDAGIHKKAVEATI